MEDSLKKLFNSIFDPKEKLNQHIYDLYEQDMLDQLMEIPEEKFETSFTYIKQSYIMKPERTVYYQQTAFTAYNTTHDALVDQIMKKISVMVRDIMDKEDYKPTYHIYVLPVEDEEKFLVFMESNMPIRYHRNLLEKCFSTKFFLKFPHCQCNPK